MKAVLARNCNIAAPTSPTHWPADSTKKLDIIDFFIAKKIATNYFEILYENELSSAHLPLVLTITTATLTRVGIVPSLTNKSTDWERYHRIIELEMKIPRRIKSPFQLDKQVNNFNELIIKAAENSTKYASSREMYVLMHLSLSCQNKFSVRILLEPDAPVTSPSKLTTCHFPVKINSL